jgi:hypothetical protein
VLGSNVRQRRLVTSVGSFACGDRADGRPATAVRRRFPVWSLLTRATCIDGDRRGNSSLRHGPHRRTAEPSPRADPHCDNGTERTECARHVWMIIVQDAAYDPAMATRDPRLAAAIAAARNGPGRREVATSTSPRPRRSQARRCQIPRSRRCGHPAADGWRAVRVNWSPRSPAWHGPFDPTEDRAGHDARVRDATPATRGAGPR